MGATRSVLGINTTVDGFDGDAAVNAHYLFS